ncbi:S8 family serine peptidase [Aeromicrobium sp. 179-A 4D2 NHS]|uniref:S8 family serine peptidase n=1 Tax=Aeromicrobium sp. 179-A 4D2 NHS TaxID=3142375 RepID=UPI0039A191CD
MVRRLIPALVALATATSLVGLQPASAQESAGDTNSATARGETSAPAVARGIMVKASSSASTRRSSLARSADAALDDSVDVAGTDAAPGGVTLLKLDDVVVVGELDDALAQLRSRPDVEWAVPDTLRSAHAAPPIVVNDPYATQQGNLWDTRSSIDGVAVNGGYATKAPALWQATSGSASAVVAVVDTGITQHPDLVGQTVAGYDFVDDECTWSAQGCLYDRTYINAGDGTGWDSNPADPGDWRDEALVLKCFGEQIGDDDPADYTQDSSWHGTHVAGTVAAKANNREGVAGVAPNVRVQPVRALGHCGGWDSDIRAAILWAAGVDLRQYGVPLNRTPAKVINLSLGSETQTAEKAREDCVSYEQVASTVRSRGATLVAAAGNASAQSIFPVSQSVPASCAGYFTVTATSDTGHRAWYSTAGTGADIAAAGGDQQVAPAGAERGILSTLNAGVTGPGAPSYGWYQGTSMATPAVAGGAALLYSLGISSPASVEAMLAAATQPFSPVKKGPQTIGGGRLTTDTIDCTTTGRTSCGRGILDLSKITAPRRPPAVTGRATSGSVLRASAYGLVGPSASGTLTWWRGSTRVSTTGAYRVRAADAGKRLTVRHTITSGPFAGIHRDTSVTVAKLGSRTAFSMPSKVKKSKRVTMKVKVSASLRPTGTIRVYDGKRRIAVKRIYSKNGGRVSIRLPKLKKGKHTIRVVYSGNSQLKASSRSKVVRSR